MFEVAAGGRHPRLPMNVHHFHYNILLFSHHISFYELLDFERGKQQCWFPDQVGDGLEGGITLACVGRNPYGFDNFVGSAGLPTNYKRKRKTDAQNHYNKYEPKWLNPFITSKAISL